MATGAERNSGGRINRGPKRTGISTVNTPTGQPSINLNAEVSSARFSLTAAPLGNDNGGRPIGFTTKTDLAQRLNSDPKQDVKAGLRDLDAHEEHWKNAEAKEVPYKKGKIPLADGSYYEWEYPGTTLLIDGKQVMDTCEYPWSRAAINYAFREISPDLEEVHVLELGIGLNLAGDRVIEKLIGDDRDGSYTGVDLNENRYHKALEWERHVRANFRAKGRRIAPSEPTSRVGINIIHGEAGKVMQKMVDCLETPDNTQRKYNIIISDTYPIKEGEEGTNDLQYLSKIVQLLAPGGVFIWYPYSPNAAQHIAEGYDTTPTQNRMLEPYFNYKATRTVAVTPQPDYDYLWRPPINDQEKALWAPAAPYLGVNKGKSNPQVLVPVRELPIGICKEPKLARLMSTTVK